MLSSGLAGKRLAEGAALEVLLHTLLSNSLPKFAGSDATANLQDLLGELESADGDDLTADVLTIDEDTFIVDDVDNGGEFAL